MVGGESVADCLFAAVSLAHNETIRDEWLVDWGWRKLGIVALGSHWVDTTMQDAIDTDLQSQSRNPSQTINPIHDTLKFPPNHSDSIVPRLAPG